VDVRSAYMRMLVEDVPRNLARFDEPSGRFLSEGGWAVTNQDVVYPLALLYTTRHPENPYNDNGEILDHAMRGADAWREFQNDDGTVEFIKIDGSTWGPTYMPWSMYHWLETYALLSDRLDAARRERWESGLILAYEGIARELQTAPVHNIPTWKGMALYRAGQVFGRPAWIEQGRQTIHGAVQAQTPLGYWREHGGPTPSYNLVYVHAIGLYYAFSGDLTVLPCLKRATDFHIRYSYPDGRVVETIDGRVKFHNRVPDLAHAAFSLFPAGRRHVRHLVQAMQQQRGDSPLPHIAYAETRGGQRPVRAEYGLSARLASAYVHYQDGPEGETVHDVASYRVHDRGHAILRRDGGWFYCLSGIVTPPVESRWGQDRQSFCSVWHEHTGLIVGGGNSRAQPEWSTFVTSEARDGYVPAAATLYPGDDADEVALVYAGRECRLRVHVVDDRRLDVVLSAAQSPACRANVLLHIVPGEPIRTGRGGKFDPDGGSFDWDADEVGGWISHRGWRLRLPSKSRFSWPVYPFNPYAEDGAAPLEEAVGVLSIPLTDGGAVVEVEVPEACRAMAGEKGRQGSG